MGSKSKWGWCGWDDWCNHDKRSHLASREQCSVHADGGREKEYEMWWLGEGKVEDSRNATFLYLLCMFSTLSSQFCQGYRMQKATFSNILHCTRLSSPSEPASFVVLVT